MSTLKDRITEDMKTAMRARDSERLMTIRMLLAACKQREVDERIELDDNAVVGLVDKLIKQRKDSVTAFTQGGRTDLADKESAEVRVLEAYLPQRLGADEIAAEVTAIVADLGASGPGDMGRVMAAAKAQLAGKAEMAAGVGSRQAGACRNRLRAVNTHLPLRAIADDVCVAPQLTPAAMAEVARAGFRAVVNNRPDFEEGATQPTNAQIEAAAHAAGLVYRFLPVSGAYQSPEDAAAMARLLARTAAPAADVLPPGARSTRLFALAQSV